MNTKKLLQLFGADDVVNATTTDTLSVEMKTFYDKTLITLADPYLVHDQFGQKRDIPKNNGKNIEFRKFSKLPKALKPLTEGVTPSGQKLNVSALTATIEQYGDYVEQTDLLELTAIDNTIVEATKELAQQAGLTMDTIVRNEIVGGTAVMYCPKVSGSTETSVTVRKDLDSTSLLRVKDVFKAAAELKAMNAPKIDGYYVGIIHPYVAYDLMQEAGTQWEEVQKYASPENMLKGEIGCLGGVRFVESTEAKIFKGEPLTAGSASLTVKTQVSSATTVTVKEAITANDVAAFAARSEVDKYVYIDGTKYGVTSLTAGAEGSASLTLASAASIAANKVLYPVGGNATNESVFATMILGANAYGVTTVTGGGLEHIVKQKGYGNDPLNQRSSIGWKGLKTAKRLVEEYMIRIESGSAFMATAEAN